MQTRRRLALVLDSDAAPVHRGTVHRATDDRATETPPLVREVYGRVLREERLDQDRSLDDVARDVGMSKQYLSEIERGRKEPSSEMLRSVCGALDLPVESLLFRSVRRMKVHRSISVAPTLLAA